MSETPPETFLLSPDGHEIPWSAIEMFAPTPKGGSKIGLVERGSKLYIVECGRCLSRGLGCTSSVPVWDEASGEIWHPHCNTYFGADGAVLLILPLKDQMVNIHIEWERHKRGDAAAEKMRQRVLKANHKSDVREFRALIGADKPSEVTP